MHFIFICDCIDIESGSAVAWSTICSKMALKRKMQGRPKPKKHLGAFSESYHLVFSSVAHVYWNSACVISVICLDFFVFGLQCFRMSSRSGLLFQNQIRNPGFLTIKRSMLAASFRRISRLGSATICDASVFHKSSSKQLVSTKVT